jgi:hypothetical protein
MPHELLDERLIGPFIRDLGALMHASTVLVGDRLGLYKAMADCKWLSPEELAARTETDTRYVAEWLAAQAASGYAEYDAPTERFRLSEEQAFVLTSEFNLMFFPGGIQAAASMIKDVDLIVDAFRDGRGVAWGEHHPDLFAGTERFFRTNYIAHLTGLLDSSAGWGGGEAARRCHGGRRRLWARRVNGHSGAGVPPVFVRWV